MENDDLPPEETVSSSGFTLIGHPQRVVGWGSGSGGIYVPPVCVTLC